MSSVPANTATHVAISGDSATSHGFATTNAPTIESIGKGFRRRPSGVPSTGAVSTTAT